ncbi:hypothetical protein [Flavobacterium suncheonense]|uniref:hypothetical protein n=1 Tax=Flavobacterium suncheonense TaxID=350894 RepID=UPI0003FDC335|nr:hypothetical protein [Flavobacterium suncheonense]
MKDKKAQIRAKLKELVAANPNLPIAAEVVSVTGNFCSVKLSGGLVLSDVRLMATLDPENGILLTPKVGSDVLVLSQTGELSGLFVVKVNEIDKLTCKNEDFEFVIDTVLKKVTIKNSGANVGQLIGQLIDTVKSAQVIVPGAGTGTIDPATQAQLTTIKTQFNSILNAN